MILSNGCVRIRFREAGQGLVQSGRADQILARERPVFRPFVCLKAEAGVFADSDENFCKELLEFATHLYKMSISGRRTPSVIAAGSGEGIPGLAITKNLQ